jgi:L-ascorbate metabolism protein UlaG (beta-lactamase superfamily)
MLSLALICLLSPQSSIVYGHQASATYLANEAVLVNQGDVKVLFDPFFHNVFGIYQRVPESIQKAIFAGWAPYDKITAIIISHAHGDHFSAPQVLDYLQKYPSTQLIGPEQAIAQLKVLAGADNVSSQLFAFDMVLNEPAQQLVLPNLLIEAVRIPHAGWPGRADIQNMLFRVTLNNQHSAITVLHMGDADPNDEHYLPYQQHWQKTLSHSAFAPYWFYSSAEGRDILSEILNVQATIGVHVPVIVPKLLEQSGLDYFSEPGEIRQIQHKH